MKTTLKNIETLTETLISERKSYIAKAIEAEINFIQNILDKIETQFDGDLHKYAPRYSSFNEWNKYAESDRKKKEISFYITSNSEKNSRCRSTTDPYFVIARDDWKERATKMTREAANSSFDKFIAKLAKKIGENEIKAAMLEGDLWERSVLKVLTDTEEQVWYTQCIINYSVYGKPFYQFPTRRARK